MNAISELLEQLTSIGFANPKLLWLGLGVILIVPLWRKLGHAMANTFGHGHKIKSVAWPQRLCLTLLCLTWLAFTCAVAEPRVSQSVFTDSYDAREFVLGIDRSGSMFSWDVEGAELAEKVHAWEKEVYARQLEKREKFPNIYPLPPEKPVEVQAGNEGKLTRYHLARYAAAQFVGSRIASSAEAKKLGKLGDRAGMFTFDDEGYWAWPLSSDLNITVRKIEGLLSRGIGGGTNFDGPDSSASFGGQQIGAFQACINHFRKWGQPGVKTKVMILISDGDAGISEKRHEELLKQMTEEGLNIHVYALVCGPRSQLENSSTQSVRKLIKAVNPDDPAHPEFQNAVIWAGDAQAMQDAFDLISRLEASTIKGEPTTQSRDVGHEFSLLVALLGALFVLSCATFRENF